MIYIRVYQYIRANGGWQNWTTISIDIDRYSATDRQNLETRERYWIETLKASLNCIIPTRTQQEFRDGYKPEKKIYDENRRQTDKLTKNSKTSIKMVSKRQNKNS